MNIKLIFAVLVLSSGLVYVSPATSVFIPNYTICTPKYDFDKCLTLLNETYPQYTKDGMRIPAADMCLSNLKNACEETDRNKKNKVFKECFDKFTNNFEFTTQENIRMFGDSVINNCGA